MAFGKKRRLAEHGVGTIEAGFCSPDLDPMSGVVVSWEGDASLIVHAPAMYLDEALLRDRAGDALRLLQRATEFFQATKEHGSKADGILLRPSVAVVNNWDFGFAAITRTTLLDTLQASTTFEPKLTATKTLHHAFWAYWSAVMTEVSESVGMSEVYSLRDNILHQCDWYLRKGLKYRHLGQAVAYGAQLGASERLRSEIGATAGFTAEEFMALPERERERLIAAHTPQFLESIGFAPTEEL